MVIKLFDLFKKFSVHAACLALAVIMLGGGLYFFNTYSRYTCLRDDFERMQARAKVVKQRATELNQKIKTIQRVERFMERVAEMEMRPEDWSSFNVNIQSWVSYKELEKIVSQCAYDRQYYFVPISFEVQTPEAVDEKDEQLQVSEAAANQGDSSLSSGSDVHLVLNGAFMIRR